MKEDWHFYGDADNYDDLFDQLAPQVPFEPPEPPNPPEHKKGVSIWVTIAVWIATLFISVGISFLLFYFDSEDKGITIDIWYTMRKSSVLIDIGLVLIVELVTYLFGLYKQKGLKLDAKNSQFVLHILSFIFAVSDTIFSVKFKAMESGTPFKLALWLVLVICSCLICVGGQIETPKKKGV